MLLSECPNHPINSKQIFESIMRYDDQKHVALLWVLTSSTFIDLFNEQHLMRQKDLFGVT